MGMSREEAIKTLKGEAWSFGSKEYREAFDMAIKALEQEPRKGHWIEVLGGCKCSCCDMAFSRLKETCADNYCPNCGADMREVEE